MTWLDVETLAVALDRPRYTRERADVRLKSLRDGLLGLCMIPMAQCYIFAAIFRERTAINERERSICAPAADVCRQRRGD